jgi:hypothetical protein
MLTLLTWSCVGLLSFLSALHSQGTHSFRAISLDTPIDDLSLISGQELVDFHIPSHRRSKVAAVGEGGALRFVARGSVIPVEGVDALPVLLEVPIASGFANPLYIFYPSAGNGGAPYRAFAIEDSPARFKAGMSIFVNLSPYPMVLLVGEDAEERIQLAPRQTDQYRFTEDSVNVRLRIATYSDGDVQKGMDTRVFPVATHRDIYFIYSAGVGEAGMVRMRLLREHANAAQRAYVRGVDARAE